MTSSLLQSVIFSFIILFQLADPTLAITRHYNFNIKLHKVTRLNYTSKIVTVNGKFPGQAIVAREGDRLIIKVTNHVKNYNVTIHWHGVHQFRNGWADGTAYITQCPIQYGKSFVHNFTIDGQRGTMFWHGHHSWQRTTLYGPLIVLPKKGTPYPFRKPYREVPIIFGEWWSADPEKVIGEALRTGGGPNVSDAYTINGFTGPYYNLSTAKDTYKLEVKPGKTYLLRLINAVLNEQLFFSIANHTLKVVQVDGTYVKPFHTQVLHIAPGQTANVLLKTKPFYPNARFYMTAIPYYSGIGTFDNSTVAGILQYQKPKPETPFTIEKSKKVPIFEPKLPHVNDTLFVANYTKKLRSLASHHYSINVPQKVDKQFFFTVSLGLDLCPANQTCLGPYGAKFAASFSNVSFTLPKQALLEAHYSGHSKGVYTPDFPPYPENPYNYTGPPPSNMMVSHGTKVVVLPFNTSVELVMQDTSILGLEDHPIHFHGYDVYVVGQGFGNFDPQKDPSAYNLVDPILRNTIGVPAGGWIAVRFVASNPGTWLIHCHIEHHISWGMMTTLIVLDGKRPNQKLIPPPSDLPSC